MSREVTLAQLRADVADQADIAGVSGLATRFAATMINRFLNQSIQLWREKVSNEGSQHYLSYVTGTLTAGATSPFPFQILDLSSTATALVRSYSFGLVINSYYRPREYMPLHQMQGDNATTGEPEFWSHYQRKQIAIHPAPDSAYTYALFYLPVQSDLVSDADTIDGASGWEQIWVWDTVLKLINRDQYPEAFQMAVGMKTELESSYMAAIRKVSQSGGGAIGRDSQGARMRFTGKRHWFPRG